jgi:hypothetical protein
VYFFAKGWLHKSNQVFKKTAEFYKKTNFPSESWFRQNYAWVLKKQGCIEKAKVQLSLAQKMDENLRSFAETKFGHANLHLNILVPKHVFVDEEFEMRLEIVNVSRNSGVILELKSVVPSNAQITSFPSFCRVQNSSIMLNQRKIGPFQVETIKLHIKLPEIGVYKSEPNVSYIDDLGTLKVNEANVTSITAQLNHLKPRLVGLANHIGILEFESEAAEKAFRYLVDAFKHDFSSKMPQEKSGWRTLMQVVRDAKISKHSLYGQSGHGGEVLSNLVNLGLIESRQFSGERGRGGRALKVRVTDRIRSERI